MDTNKILSFLILFFSLWLISCGDNNNSSSDINPCTNNPCALSPVPHKTVCKADENDFTCTCEEGYIEENGACKKEEINPCEPNPCTEEHKTICKASTDNNFTCSCEEEYIQNSEGKCELPVKCETDSCTEPHKTVCSIENNKIKCSCEAGFIENEQGNCEKSDDFKIRIMAANITSGRKQSYKPNGIRIFQAVKPDIVLIQEFNYLDEYDDSLPIRELIDTAFGSEFNYFRGAGRIPNGVISRFPIIDSGNWDDSSINDRTIVWAKIKLPNNKFLWAISVHLSTKNNLTGARDSVSSILAKHIPPEDYIVYGGDFNTKSRTAGTISELGKVFTVSAPWPVGYNDFSDHYTCYKCYKNYSSAEECGNKFNCDVSATSYERDDPYDWVIADKNNLNSLQIPTIYCNDSNNSTDCLTFNSGLVFDSRDYTQEELDKYFYPVKVGDCSREPLEIPEGENIDDYMNFQHMAVIKDFLIPN